MSEPMSDERLSEIRARYSTTTKGEWGYDLNGTVAVIEDDGEWGISVCQIPRGSRYATNQDRCDMEFIAMAHKYLPALVNENERLRAELHPDCYCVCHSAISSCPSCDHCKGINAVSDARLRAELKTAKDNAAEINKFLLPDFPDESQAGIMKELRAYEAHCDAAEKREADLREALKEVVYLSDRKCAAWDRAKQAIAKSEGK